MATRAIGKTKPIVKKAAPKAAPKKTATKVVAKAAPMANPFAKLSLPKAAPKANPKANPKAAPKAVAKKAAPKVAPKAVAKKAAPKAAPKKVVAKKVAPVVKKVVAKKAAPVAKKAAAKKAPTIKLSVPKIPSGRGKTPPPASKSYPSFQKEASGIKFGGIAGTGLFPAANGGFKQPDFSDPKLQKVRDPAFYAAAAASRAAKLASTDEFIRDDGLTDLERRQRKTQANFLTGSAKSQKDDSAIIGDIDAPAFGGLSADRFQLLFISIFGLFTLVGSLANSTPYTTGL